MKSSKSLYHGHRFPAVVISCAVRWYFRFQLSLRDIEELLFERGIVVSYETVAWLPNACSSQRGGHMACASSEHCFVMEVNYGLN
jgi:transposase-like protein